MTAIRKALVASLVALTTVGSGLVAGTAASADVPTTAPASIVGAAAPAQAQGAITWYLVRASNPSADQQDAYNRITSAMNAAVARYNAKTSFRKHLTVHYDTSVRTANGNINGTIRFGADRRVMDEQTALHEMSHTLGVGTSGRWGSLTSGGRWQGANANALIKQFNGANAVINAGGGHFWPYGLNSDSEYNATSADRHVQIVEAMRRDGL